MNERSDVRLSRSGDWSVGPGGIKLMARILHLLGFTWICGTESFSKRSNNFRNDAQTGLGGLICSPSPSPHHLSFILFYFYGYFPLIFLLVFAPYFSPYTRLL